MNKTLIALLMATSVLAACDGGGSTPVAPPPPAPPPAPPPGPTGPTGPGLAEVVQGIFRTTSETALPIDINSLDLDPSDETPTLYDNLLV